MDVILNLERNWQPLVTRKERGAETALPKGMGAVAVVFVGRERWDSLASSGKSGLRTDISSFAVILRKLAAVGDEEGEGS